jgi:hypothetical protein
VELIKNEPIFGLRDTIFEKEKVSIQSLIMNYNFQKRNKRKITIFMVPIPIYNPNFMFMGEM